MSDKLTTKQRLFVEAYLLTSNATESARRAGYKGNDNTLGVVGNENLSKPKIAEMVGKRVEAAAMTADEVLRELADIAKSDWRDHVEIQYGKDGEMLAAKLKLGDKIKALELIGKHHKIFTDKTEHSGPNGGPIEQVFKIELTDD